jgi:predicted dehydrogenase
VGTPESILRVGVVGCGNIVEQYLTTLPHLENVRLVAAADLDPARAQGVAARVAGARALSVDDLIADPDVDLVLNLTIPAVHHEIAAGKQVYGEKPLADTVAHAREILRAADAAGVTVGSAPDTVLGSGIQTARKAVDDGLIGRPIAATASMTTPGHERWHPNPDFYYQPGGGPLLDMGPYYVTALITLLGPVVSVVGAASSLRDERTIGSGPRAGERIPVDVDTHVTGVLVHASGALSTLIMSFDTVGSRASRIEVHGEHGSLIVPDPNNFDGDTQDEDEWRTLDQSAGYVGVGRGIGLQDLALAEGSPRASGAVAFHALEVMESLIESAHEGRAITISSTCERPSAVPLTTVA